MAGYRNFTSALAKRLETLRERIQWVRRTVDDGCAFESSANGCLRVK
jgi:hypothetical protein